MNYLFTSPGR